MTDTAPPDPLGEMDPRLMAYLMENHPDAAGLAARPDRSLLMQVLARCVRLADDVAAAKAASQEWLSVEDFAAAVGKAKFTVREWCRRGRITARKKGSGRGTAQEWAVPRAELLRYQKDGLLPLTQRRS